MTSMRVCAHQLLRQSSGLRVAAPLRPAMRGKVARRSFATESGGEGGQHWSKDKAQVSNIKKYGTMSMVGAFAAGLSWRTYQWATGTLPDTTLSGAPKSTAAAVPTEEALAAATKKSVVHWEGEARAPVGLASEATPAAAAAAAAAEDELDYPEGSAKAMKLAYDLEQIVQRLAKVGDAVGCPEPKVVTHVALLKLKPEATTADKDEIVAGLRRLPSQIPEISAFRAGEDLGLDPSGRSIALVGEFASVDDYKAAAAPVIIEQLRKLPEMVGPIQEYCVGADLGFDPSGQTLAVVGSFKCKGCYDGYAKNTDHQAVITDYIKPALSAGGRAASQFGIVS